MGNPRYLNGDELRLVMMVRSYAKPDFYCAAGESMK